VAPAAVAGAPATGVAATGAGTGADAAFFFAQGGVLRYSQLGTGSFFIGVGGDIWAPSFPAGGAAAGSASPVGFGVVGVLAMSFPGVDVVRGVAEAICSLAGGAVAWGTVPGS
jgi:hypothetical protein